MSRFESAKNLRSLAVVTREFRVVAIFSLVCAGFVLSALLTGCGGKTKGPPWGTLKESRGAVHVKTSADSTWETAQPGRGLSVGEILRTGDDGQASLETISGNLLAVREDTFFEIRAGETFGHQERGKVHFTINSQGKREVKITTPHAQTAVLGTVFNVSVQDTATEVSLFRGKVRVTSVTSGQEQILLPGQGARVSREKMEIIPFSLPEGNPAEFTLPAAQSGSKEQSSPAGSSAETPASGALVPPAEDLNKIDLNEPSTETEDPDTHSLGNVLQENP